MVRFFAVVFGLGYLAYLVLELITVIELEPDSPCHNPLKAASGFLNIIFVVLQGSLIVFYPRLNLNINAAIDR